MKAKPQTNQLVITAIVCTVCAAAIIGVGTEAMCVVYKIPDMSNAFSNGFVHVVDTLIGALIAMLINTRPQEQKPDGPSTVSIDQPPGDPVPVTQTPK